MPALDSAEVCVLGGGPAACVSARLLASWGRSVVVIHRRPGAPPLAESLPSSTRKILALAGLSSEIDAAGFFPNFGNHAIWAGHERWAVSPTAGFHVRRDRWDRILLSTARAAGARTVEGAVRRVDMADEPRVVASGANGHPFTIAAQYVLDCSGRAGVLARNGLRRCGNSYRTLAIAAEWVTDDWPLDERTTTAVESYSDGWSWSVPLSSTSRQCTVMIDPDRIAPRSRAPLQERYARELAGTRALSARLRGARQVGRAWACDASTYDCVRAADGRAILVGDAASFVEPLSSAGVKKAMLSGWRAAIVANTCLRDSQRASVALDYHCARERQVFASCGRETERFFAEAAAAHGGRFWDARGGSAFPAGPGPGTDDDVLAADDVAVAFDRLRSTGTAPLRVSPALRIAASPVIEGREVVLREAVSLPGLEQPIRFASNVDLPALIGIVRRHDDVSSALAAYQAEVNCITAADVLRGLSLLVARHAILHEEIRP